jgi:hypothetical protein
VLQWGDGSGHEEERLKPGVGAVDNGAALVAPFIRL